MPDAFVHRIDPILGSIGGVHFWWYGLGYAVGFLNVHWSLRRARRRLGMTRSEVGSLSLCLSLGVLGGPPSR